MLTTAEYRQRASELIRPDVWDYLDGGSGEERTVAANLDAYARVRLRPRVLVDVRNRSTATEVLGTPLAVPLGVAPTAYHRLVHPDGEVATARGAGAAGAVYTVSIFASRTLEEIAEAATGPLWLQLYWLRERDVLAELVNRAVDAGYRAIVLTVDTPVLGERLRDVRNGFALDPSIRAANLDRALTEVVHRHRRGSSALAVHAQQAFDTALTWDDLAWLRELSPLPILLKGVLTGEDAARAVECGMAGVIVSNHGGRQLDRAVATLDALPEVVRAVAGRALVAVDGGVRDGTDVFAALALGADLVLVGRPALWGLACAGARGVSDVLGLLGRQLSDTMALTGRPALADIDPSVLAPSAPGGTHG